MPDRILFVTGKLAEPALRQLVADLAPKAGFDYEIAALKITVAALMTPQWVAHQLRVPPGVSEVVLPGWCQGDLTALEQCTGLPVILGPKDLRDLPEYFGQAAFRPPGYGAYDIEILAEINHAPRLSREEILALARRYRDDGADVIDLGCDPAGTWTGVADCVRQLRDEGFRVSIDSFEPKEVEAGVRAGAELILSVHAGPGGNLELARDLGCEVVAVPQCHPPGAETSASLTPAPAGEGPGWGPHSSDLPSPTGEVPARHSSLVTRHYPWIASLDAAIEKLAAWNVRYRIDPVLEPIGFGFAASLGRYLEAGRRWPNAETMMGVGNLTELTDADSAGINVLLAGFCQELGVRSILTTEVINWARSSVKEWDLARRLAHYACSHRVLPKHLEPGLHLLRDPKVHEHGRQTLDDLARRITDPNFRIFAEAGEIHLMNSRGHWHGTDPFALFQAILAAHTADAPRAGTTEDAARSATAAHSRHPASAIDPSHAFYLGFELAKALTALTLSKDYTQDQPLSWGFLNRPN